MLKKLFFLAVMMLLCVVATNGGGLNVIRNLAQTAAKQSAKQAPDIAASAARRSGKLASTIVKRSRASIKGLRKKFFKYAEKTANDFADPIDFITQSSKQNAKMSRKLMDHFDSLADMHKLEITRIDFTFGPDGKTIKGINIDGVAKVDAGALKTYKKMNPKLMEKINTDIHNIFIQNSKWAHYMSTAFTRVFHNTKKQLGGDYAENFKDIQSFANHIKFRSKFDLKGRLSLYGEVKHMRGPEILRWADNVGDETSNTIVKLSQKQRRLREIDFKITSESYRLRLASDFDSIDPQLAGKSLREAQTSLNMKKKALWRLRKFKEANGRLNDIPWPTNIPAGLFDSTGKLKKTDTFAQIDMNKEFYTIPSQDLTGNAYKIAYRDVQTYVTDVLRNQMKPGDVFESIDYVADTQKVLLKVKRGGVTETMELNSEQLTLINIANQNQMTFLAAEVGNTVIDIDDVVDAAIDFEYIADTETVLVRITKNGETTVQKVPKPTDTTSPLYAQMEELKSLSTATDDLNNMMHVDFWKTHPRQNPIDDVLQDIIDSGGDLQILQKAIETDDLDGLMDSIIDAHQDISSRLSSKKDISDLQKEQNALFEELGVGSMEELDENIASLNIARTTYDDTPLDTALRGETLIDDSVSGKVDQLDDFKRVLQDVDDELYDEISLKLREIMDLGGSEFAPGKVKSEFNALIERANDKIDQFNTNMRLVNEDNMLNIASDFKGVEDFDKIVMVRDGNSFKPVAFDANGDALDIDVRYKLFGDNADKKIDALQETAIINRINELQSVVTRRSTEVADASAQKATKAQSFWKKSIKNAKTEVNTLNVFQDIKNQYNEVHEFLSESAKAYARADDDAIVYLKKIKRQMREFEKQGEYMGDWKKMCKTVDGCIKHIEGLQVWNRKVGNYIQTSLGQTGAVKQTHEVHNDVAGVVVDGSRDLNADEVLENAIKRDEATNEYGDFLNALERDQGLDVRAAYQEHAAKLTDIEYSIDEMRAFVSSTPQPGKINLNAQFSNVDNTANIKYADIQTQVSNELKNRVQPGDILHSVQKINRDVIVKVRRNGVLVDLKIDGGDLNQISSNKIDEVMSIVEDDITSHIIDKTKNNLRKKRREHSDLLKGRDSNAYAYVKNQAEEKQRILSVYSKIEDLRTIDMDKTFTTIPLRDDPLKFTLTYRDVKRYVTDVVSKRMEPGDTFKSFDFDTTSGNVLLQVDRNGVTKTITVKSEPMVLMYRSLSDKPANIRDFEFDQLKSIIDDDLRNRANMFTDDELFYLRENNLIDESFDMYDTNFDNLEVQLKTRDVYDLSDIDDPLKSVRSDLEGFQDQMKTFESFSVEGRMAYTRNSYYDKDIRTLKLNNPADPDADALEITVIRADTIPDENAIAKVKDEYGTVIYEFPDSISVPSDMSIPYLHKGKINADTGNNLDDILNSIDSIQRGVGTVNSAVLTFPPLDISNRALPIDELMGEKSSMFSSLKNQLGDDKYVYLDLSNVKIGPKRLGDPPNLRYVTAEQHQKILDKATDLEINVKIYNADGELEHVVRPLDRHLYESSRVTLVQRSQTVISDVHKQRKIAKSMVNDFFGQDTSLTTKTYHIDDTMSPFEQAKEIQEGGEKLKQSLRLARDKRRAKQLKEGRTPDNLPTDEDIEFIVTRRVPGYVTDSKSTHIVLGSTPRIEGEVQTEVSKSLSNMLESLHEVKAKRHEGLGNYLNADKHISELHHTARSYKAYVERHTIQDGTGTLKASYNHKWVHKLLDIDPEASMKQKIWRVKRYIILGLQYFRSVENLSRGVMKLVGAAMHAAGRATGSRALTKYGGKMKRLTHYPQTVMTAWGTFHYGRNGRGVSKVLEAAVFGSFIVSQVYKQTKIGYGFHKRLKKTAQTEKTNEPELQTSRDAMMVTYLQADEKPHFFGSVRDANTVEDYAGRPEAIAATLVMEMATNIELPIQQDNYIGVLHEDLTSYEIQMIRGETIPPKRVEHFVTWHWEDPLWVETAAERSTSADIRFSTGVNVYHDCNLEEIYMCSQCGTRKICHEMCMKCKQQIMDRRELQNERWGRYINYELNNDHKHGYWKAYFNYIGETYDVDKFDEKYALAWSELKRRFVTAFTSEKRLFMSYYCEEALTQEVCISFFSDSFLSLMPNTKCLEECLPDIDDTSAAGFRGTSVPIFATLYALADNHHVYEKSGRRGDGMTIFNDPNINSEFDHENAYSFWQLETGPWGPNHMYIPPGGGRDLFYAFLIFERNMGRPASFEWKAQHRLVENKIPRTDEEQLVSDFDISLTNDNEDTELKLATCKNTEPKYALTEQINIRDPTMHDMFFEKHLVQGGESTFNRVIDDQYKQIFIKKFKNHHTRIFSICKMKQSITAHKTGRIRTREIWPDESHPYYQKNWPCQYLRNGLVPGTMSPAFFVKEVRFPAEKYTLHTIQDYITLNTYRLAINIMSESIAKVLLSIVFDLALDIVIKDTETWRRIADIYGSDGAAKVDDYHTYKDFLSKCYVSYYAQPEMSTTPSLINPDPVCFKVGADFVISESSCERPNVKSLPYNTYKDSEPQYIYNLDLRNVSSVAPGLYTGYAKHCFEGVIDGSQCISPPSFESMSFQFGPDCKIRGLRSFAPAFLTDPTLNEVGSTVKFMLRDSESGDTMRITRERYCLIPNNGFFLLNGETLPCEDGCARCDMNQCFDTFDASGNLIQCEYGCKRCSEDGCLEVYEGFYIVNTCETGCKHCDAGGCLVPDDGYRLVEKIPVACEANCKQCNIHECMSAADGYHLVNGNLTACDVGCKQCTDHQCLEPQDGYYIQADGSVTQWCQSNCSQCDATAFEVAGQHDILSSSTSGYKNVVDLSLNDARKMCSEETRCDSISWHPFSTYFYSLGDWSNIRLGSSSRTIFRKTCPAAEDGYYVADGVKRTCQENCKRCNAEACIGIDVKPCQENCKRCTAEECLEAQDGYHIDEDGSITQWCKANCSQCDATAFEVAGEFHESSTAGYGYADDISLDEARRRCSEDDMCDSFKWSNPGRTNFFQLSDWNKITLHSYGTGTVFRKTCPAEEDGYYVADGVKRACDVGCSVCDANECLLANDGYYIQGGNITACIPNILGMNLCKRCNAEDCLELYNHDANVECKLFHPTKHVYPSTAFQSFNLRQHFYSTILRLLNVKLDREHYIHEICYRECWHVVIDYKNTFMKTIYIFDPSNILKLIVPIVEEFSRHQLFGNTLIQNVMNVGDDGEITFEPTEFEFKYMPLYEYGACEQLLTLHEKLETYNNSTGLDSRNWNNIIDDLLNDDKEIWDMYEASFYVASFKQVGTVRYQTFNKRIFDDSIRNYVTRKISRDLLRGFIQEYDEQIVSIGKSMDELNDFYEKIKIDPDDIKHRVDKQDVAWWYHQIMDPTKLSMHLRTSVAVGIVAADTGLNAIKKINPRRTKAANLIAYVSSAQIHGAGVTAGLFAFDNPCKTYADSIGNTNFDCSNLEEDLANKRKEQMDIFSERLREMRRDIADMKLHYYETVNDAENEFLNIRGALLDPCMLYLVGPGTEKHYRKIPDMCDLSHFNGSLKYTTTSLMTACPQNMSNSTYCMKATTAILQRHANTLDSTFGREKYEIGVLEDLFMHDVFYMLGDNMKTVFGHMNTTLDGENRVLTLQLEEMELPGIKNVVFHESSFTSLDIGYLKDVSFTKSRLVETVFFHKLENVVFSETVLDRVSFNGFQVVGHTQLFSNVLMENIDFICGSDFKYTNYEDITFQNVRGCTVECIENNETCIFDKYLLLDNVAPHGYHFEHFDLRNRTIPETWLNERLLSCPRGANVYCDDKYPSLHRTEYDKKRVRYDTFPAMLNLSGHNLKGKFIDAHILQGDLNRSDVFGVTGRLRECITPPDRYECGISNIIVGEGVHIEHANVDTLFQQQGVTYEDRKHISTKDVTCEDYCDTGVYVNEYANLEGAEFKNVTYCPLNYARFTYGRPKTDVTELCNDAESKTSNNIMYLVYGDSFDRKTRVNLHTDMMGVYESRFEGHLTLKSPILTHARFDNSLVPVHFCEYDYDEKIHGVSGNNNPLLNLFSYNDKMCFFDAVEERWYSALVFTTTDDDCNTCTMGPFGDAFCAGKKWDRVMTVPTLHANRFHVGPYLMQNVEDPLKVNDALNVYNLRSTYCAYQPSTCVTEQRIPSTGFLLEEHCGNISNTMFLSKVLDMENIVRLDRTYWVSYVPEHLDIGLNNENHISRRSYPGLTRTDRFNVGKVNCRLDPLWENEHSFIIDFHRTDEASITYNQIANPLYMYYHGKHVLQPKREFTVTDDTYPLKITSNNCGHDDCKCKLIRHVPEYFETRFGSDDGYDDYHYRRCETPTNISETCKLTGEGIDFTGIHFFHDNTRFKNYATFYSPSTQELVINNPDAWRGDRIEHSWGYRPVHLYPGEVRGCPNNDDSAWGMSPVTYRGGSRCIFNHETKRGLFFGPKIKIQARYVQCDIRGNDIRRHNLHDEKTWRSPVNINEEFSVDISVNVSDVDIDRVTKQGLYIKRYVGNTPQFSRSEMKFENVKLNVDNCVEVDRLPSDKTIVIETYDPISKSIRNAKCLLRSRGDGEVFLNAFDEQPLSKYEVNIPNMHCFFMHTEDEMEEIEYKITKCFDDPDLQDTPACSDGNRRFTRDEIEQRVLQDFHRCTNELSCDFHPIFSPEMPSYLDYVSRNDTITLPYSLLVSDVDLSGVDLTGADLSNMNLQTDLFNLYACPALLPPGFECVRGSEQNEHDWKIITTSSCKNYRTAVASWKDNDSPYVQPLHHGVHKNDHFNPNYMFADLLESLQPLDWRNLIVNLPAVPEYSNIFTYAGLLYEDQRVQKEDLGITHALGKHMNTYDEFSRHVDIKYELEKNQVPIAINKKVRYRNCPESCKKCTAAECLEWDDGFNGNISHYIVVPCPVNYEDCSSGIFSGNINPSQEMYDTFTVEEVSLQHIFKDRVVTYDKGNISYGHKTIVIKLDTCNVKNSGESLVDDGYQRQLIDGIPGTEIPVTFDYRCSKSSFNDKFTRKNLICLLSNETHEIFNSHDMCDDLVRKPSTCALGVGGCSSTKLEKISIGRAKINRQAPFKCAEHCLECKGTICLQAEEGFYIKHKTHRGYTNETELIACGDHCKACNEQGCIIPKKQNTIIGTPMTSRDDCDIPSSSGSGCLWPAKDHVLVFPDDIVLSEIINSDGDTCNGDGYITFDNKCRNRYSSIKESSTKNHCPDQTISDFKSNTNWGLVSREYEYTVKNDGKYWNGFPKRSSTVTYKDPGLNHVVEEVTFSLIKEMEMLKENEDPSSGEDYWVYDIYIPDDDLYKNEKRTTCKHNRRNGGDYADYHRWWWLHRRTYRRFDTGDGETIERDGYRNSIVRDHDNMEWNFIETGYEHDLEVARKKSYCIFPKSNPPKHKTVQNTKDFAHPGILSRVKIQNRFPNILNGISEDDVNPCFCDIQWNLRKDNTRGSTFEVPEEWERFWNGCKDKSLSEKIWKKQTEMYDLKPQDYPYIFFEADDVFYKKCLAGMGIIATFDPNGKWKNGKQIEEPKYDPDCDVFETVPYTQYRKETGNCELEINATVNDTSKQARCGPFEDFNIPFCERKEIDDQRVSASDLLTKGDLSGERVKASSNTDIKLPNTQRTEFVLSSYFSNAESQDHEVKVDKWIEHYQTHVFPGIVGFSHKDAVARLNKSPSFKNKFSFYSSSNVEKPNGYCNDALDLDCEVCDHELYDVIREFAPFCKKIDTFLRCIEFRKGYAGDSQNLPFFNYSVTSGYTVREMTEDEKNTPCIRGVVVANKFVCVQENEAPANTGEIPIHTDIYCNAGCADCNADEELTCNEPQKGYYLDSDNQAHACNDEWCDECTPDGVCRTPAINYYLKAVYDVVQTQQSSFPLKTAVQGLTNVTYETTYPTMDLGSKALAHSICSRDVCNASTHVYKTNGDDIMCAGFKCDVQTCCNPRAVCNRNACRSSTHILKLNHADLFCTQDTCSLVDQNTCCVEASFCNSSLCGENYVYKMGGDLIPCTGLSCNEETCCERRASCDLNACFGVGESFVANITGLCEGAKCIPSIDNKTCCKQKQVCDGTACNNETHILRPDYAHIFCNGSECTQDQCCEPMDLCSNAACDTSTHHLMTKFRKIDETSPLWPKCQGSHCAPSKDQDTCCELHPTCNSEACDPSTHVLKQNAGAFRCTGETCNPSNDQDICCEPRAPCDYASFCDRITHSPKSNALCTGAVCDRLVDTDACCSRKLVCNDDACNSTTHVLKSDYANIHCVSTLFCHPDFDQDTCCVPKEDSNKQFCTSDTCSTTGIHVPKQDIYNIECIWNCTLDQCCDFRAPCDDDAYDSTSHILKRTQENDIITPCEANCKVCNSEGCLEPVDGYNLQSGILFACEVGCKQCNVSHCLVPQDGYYIDVKRVDCETGCKQCNAHDDCLQVADGYYYEFTTNKILQCVDGCKHCNDRLCFEYFPQNYINPLDHGYRLKHVLIQCEANCNHCNAEECLEPINGYYIEDGSPAPCEANCSHCNANGCLEPGDGYYIKDGSPAACEVGCNECNASGCINYKVCGANCKRCTDHQCLEPQDGYYIQADGSVTQWCQSNCSQCDATAFEVAGQHDILSSSTSGYKNVVDLSLNDARKMCSEETRCDSISWHTFSTYFYSLGDWSKISLGSSSPGRTIFRKTCPAAEDGYYVADGVKRTCQENCKRCTAEECLEAQDGYHIDEDGSITQWCKANCSQCDATAFEVAGQYNDGSTAGYGHADDISLDEARRRCSEDDMCDSFKWSNPGRTNFFQLSDWNKITLGSYGPSTVFRKTCPAEEDGYYVADGVKRACETNCKHCDANECLIADDGYYIQDGNITLCETGCKHCDANECFIADDGYYIQDGNITLCETGCKHCDANKCEIPYVCEEKCTLCNAHGCIKPNEGYYIANPLRCDGTECIKSIDQITCSTPKAWCNSMACDDAHTPKANFWELRCSGSICNVQDDQSICCDQKAPCSSHVCSNSHKVKHGVTDSTLCEGSTCEENEDTCCEPKKTCDQNACISEVERKKLDKANYSHPYILKSNYYELFCDEDNCIIDNDRETCCDVRVMCNEQACSNSHILKLPVSNIMCEGAVCIPILDQEKCCVPRATCDEIACSDSDYVLKDNFKNILCEGTQCQVNELHTCCEQRKPCNENACNPRTHVLKSTTSLCVGLTCDATIDQDTCCEPRAPCEAELCTSDLNIRVRSNIESLLCVGSQCNVDTDTDICCQDQMTTSMTTTEIYYEATCPEGCKVCSYTLINDQDFYGATGIHEHNLVANSMKIPLQCDEAQPGYILKDVETPCMDACETCSDTYPFGSCLTLKTGYSRYGLDGIIKCKHGCAECNLQQCTKPRSGFYFSGEYILPCIDGCSECDGPSWKNCLRADKDFFANETFHMYDGKPMVQILNYTLSTDVSSCEPGCSLCDAHECLVTYEGRCDPACKVCDERSQCWEAADGFFLEVMEKPPNIMNIVDDQYKLTPLIEYLFGKWSINMIRNLFPNKIASEWPTMIDLSHILYFYHTT